MLNKYNFYISSSQRFSGSPSNFNIKLNQDVGLSKNVDSFFKVYIHSATIPFSFNQWNQNNYTTQFLLTQSGRSYTGSFDIPKGNYDINTFTSAWKNAVETKLLAVAGYQPNITFTYSNDTNKLTFFIPFDSTDSVITFYNSQPYSYVNLALGFQTQWTLPVFTSRTSAVQCNVSPARNLYLYSNTMSSPTNFEALTSDMITSTQLCCIPITVIPNNYIIYTPFNRLISHVSNKSFSQFNFQLQSEDLDLNLSDFDLDWSMVFVVEEWSKQDASTNLLQFFIQNKQDELSNQKEELNKLRKQIVDELQNIKINEEEKIKSLTNSKDEKNPTTNTTDRIEKIETNTKSVDKQGTRRANISKKRNDNNTTKL